MSVDVEALKDFIRAHARACLPYEACGLIVRKGEKQKVICCRNVADHPDHGFFIHPDDAAAAHREGEVIGLYHSHCNESPAPSKADKTLSEKHKLPVIIVSWPADQWEIYTPTGYRAELTGRPFVYGVLDCLTLLQDYFMERHGIKIGDIGYGPKWYRTQDLYQQNLPKQGFVQVAELQPDDLILMNTADGFPNHIAIYVGDGMMLHHPVDHLSGYHPYVYERGFYAQRTVSFWRHRQLMEAAA